MVARWIANLILLLMLIGLALGIRYELMVTDLASQQIGDAATAPRRIELEPAQPDIAPGQSSAPPAASRGTAATPDAISPLGTALTNRSPGPPGNPVESPPVVRLKPEPGLPNQDQDQAVADAAPEGSPGATTPKAPPMGFGVDPFAPDEVPPSPVVRSKTGGAPAPRRH